MPRPRIAFMLRALAYPNYRLFFGGQIVSLIGSWISITATSWLVYRLTGSAMALGLVGFAGQFPGFVMGPFAGAYLDRWDRHRVLVVTQTISMCQSFVLAFLTFTGHITVPVIIVLNAIQGMVNAFDMPARQAFLTTMITDREDLANAIALNSSMFNAARLVGPSIAGVMIAIAGESWCFFVDGVSYFAVIIALVAMKDVSRLSPAGPHAGILEHLLEGWRYVFGFRPIRSLMLQLAWLCLVAMPFSVLMPVFADEILGGGAHTLGFLMAASGLGALSGALWLTTRKSVVGLGRVIVCNTVVFGVRVDWIRALAFAAGFARVPDGRRLRHDGANGVDEHRDSDDRRRGEARTRDELLHHGVSRDGAVRQPAGGLALDAHRRAAHGRAERRAVHGDGPVVRERITRHPSARAPDLHAHGHPARKLRRGCRQRKSTKTEQNVETSGTLISFSLQLCDAVLSCRQAPALRIASAFARRDE